MKAHSKNDRSTRRRLDIARAAATVFRRKGFAASTVEDIAGALGMTKGSLYYYFRDKGDILFFCQNWSLDRMLEAADRIRRARLRPSEKVAALVREQMGYMLDELAGTAAHIQTDALAGARWRKLVAKRDRFERAWRAIVQDGIRRREFRDLDAKAAVRAILGAVNWTITWFRPDGPETSGRLAEKFADVFVAGLRRRERGKQGERGK